VASAGVAVAVVVVVVVVVFVVEVSDGVTNGAAAEVSAVLLVAVMVVVYGQYVENENGKSVRLRFLYNMRFVVKASLALVLVLSTVSNVTGSTCKVVTSHFLLNFDSVRGTYFPVNETLHFLNNLASGQ
jgi:hypothetical protein